MSNTPRILDLEIELPLVSNSIIVDEKIAEHNADEEAHPYILGILDGKANSADLATVATTGDYDDLENKPDIEDIATNVAGGVVSAHNESETAHADIRDEIGTVRDIAEGANIAIVFDNYSDLVTFFNNESNTLKVGTNLYVKTIEVPDLWISSVEVTSVSYAYTTDEDFLSYINGNGQIGYYKFSELETQKVDLSNYATLTDLSGKVSKSGDTMTGNLTMDGAPVIIKVNNNQLWKVTNNSTHLEVAYSANGGTSWSVKQRLYATQDRALFTANNVYVGNQPTDNNYILQKYSDIFTTGVVSDTKTWATDADGKYYYTLSNPVSGPIPKAFITQWNTLAGLYGDQNGASQFNATTGYFELNGLHDITYEEAMVILAECGQLSMANSTYPHARTTLSVRTNGLAMSRQFQSSDTEIAYCGNISWSSSSTTTTTTFAYTANHLREITGFRFSSIQGQFNIGGGTSNNTLPSLEIIRCTNGPIANVNLRSAPNFTLAGVVELVSKAQGNNSITFRFSTKTYQACQADTHQYTWNGQIYVGVLSYAAAKNITITD